MLVALAGMSVLAQGSRPSAKNAIGAFNASADTLITGAITEVVITNLPLVVETNAPNWTALPVVPENIETDATELVESPAIIGGPKYDQDGSNGDPATDVFAVPGTITESDTTAAGMYTIPITLATGIVAANIDAALPRDSYTFQVRLVIDTNNAADGAADDDEDTANDRDLTLTARVTINVMRVNEELAFDVDPAKAVKGALVSGLRRPIGTNPLEWEVKGIGSSAKLVRIGLADAAVPGAVGDFQIKETPAGSGKFRLFVVNSGAAALLAPLDVGVVAVYDEDTAVDSDDLDTTEKDQNADVTIELTGTVNNHGSLQFESAPETLLVPDMEGIHFKFTIPSNEPADTPIGFFRVGGGIDGGVGEDTQAGTPDDPPDEYLDGIISGPDGAPFDVRDSDMTLIYKGSPALEVKTYTLNLTVSGDAGLANRTIIGKATVTVTASNLAPSAPGTFLKNLEENEPGVDVTAEPDATPPVAGVSGLVKPGTVVGDASVGVTSNDNDSVIYELDSDGDSVFDIDSETGIITVGDSGILDTKGGPDDDPDTDDEDTEYDRIGIDFGELVNPDDEFSNITYTFKIKVTDGVSANDQSIDATVTLKVNEPILKTGDPGDDMGVVKYETTDVQNHVIVDLNEFLTDVDSSLDKVVYSMETVPPNPPFGEYLGKVRINYPGATRPTPATEDEPAWDPKIDGWVVTVKIGDAFANSDPPTFALPLPDDAEEDDVPEREAYTDPALDPQGVDAVLIFTIKQIPGPPLQSYPLTFEVDENATVGAVIGSLGPHVQGAVAFSVVSGTGGAQDDFAVNEDTGEITVVNPRDYDAPGAENNIVLLVDAFGANGIRLGAVIAGIAIQDLNEAPLFVDQPATGYVAEEGEPNRSVMTANPDLDDTAVVLMVVADDKDVADTGASYAIKEKVPFTISATGVISVNGNLDADNADNPNPYVLTIVGTDLRDGTLMSEHEVSITVGDLNDAPVFTVPQGGAAALKDEKAVSETRTYADGAILSFAAEDPDFDELEFTIRTGKSQELFEISDVVRVKDASGDFTGAYTGNLYVKRGPKDETDHMPLDYEADDYDRQTGHLVNIDVDDRQGGKSLLRVDVFLINENDNAPQFNVAPATMLTVAENTARESVLSNYAATDADGQTVTYSLSGDDAKSFYISDTGVLMTLESLDADSQVPCGADGCAVTVIATDGTHNAPTSATNDAPPSVRISVTAVEDSVSTPHITKANPVPGTEQGKPGSALAGTKSGGDEYLWNLLDCAGMLELVDSTDSDTYCKMWDGLSTTAKAKVSAALKRDAPNEAPYDLPATYGSSPKNFVETEWANWGTVLRIEVTAESPDATCGVDVGGNNNQCVELIVKSDSADDVIHLAAYRSNEQENRYVAAVMLVELEAHASNYVLNSGGDEVRTPIYRHQRVRNVVPSAARTDPALQVPRLQADEEDEIEIEFHNLRTDIDVENEPPEISNVSPEHEAAFDDADVEYTFSVSDDNSGLPEPEDLPDTNGDEDYTPVVGLVSDRQCVIDDPDDGVLARAIHIHESEYLYCGDNAQDGEYIANEGGWGFAPIRDDKDFDETSDGFDVETTLVLVKNEIFYVTFIACDRAGNCTSYDPDGNDNDAELAKITIDTEVPEFVEARTGVKWDSSDNEYGDDRSFIQVIFDDLTPLNEETVESDDFVVEGHTVKAVYIYSPDDEDTLWADENSDGTLNADTDPTRYANGGPNSEWGDRGALYRKIDRTVFLELEDELLADETPDVTIIPNGVEDQAGNEQDDGDVEAKDWIAPRFVVVSIVAADTPEGASNQLAGDGDEVTVMVTSDERLDQTRPEVTVTYVDASMVDTKGTATCGTDGKRKRGEITMNTAGKTSTDCADNALATGDELNNHIEKITNTEWMVTVTEPKATGYYNFHIIGADRSPRKNEGSEGVGADEIVTEFFDSDGDVNADDAVFWEADINLPNPNIRVSGVAVTDNEASVEFRSPLFVEIDFTVNHWVSVDCDDVETDDRMANCMNENSEYSEDNFDEVVVTMFQLDGVDMTDSVKTTDSQTFLVSLESVSIGDHTVLIQGMDQAGNILEDTLEIDFEVNDRDPFEKRLSPGWNLVSLPGEPANSNIASVFGSDVEVRTVYTYDPVIPGGWMVAVRETLESDWQGDLTEISGQRGYWVLSDAIQDWEVSIPRLAGGAAGTGTPIQPPVIALYAGWNLIPVIDISGDGAGGDTIRADVYLEKLGDGLDLARVLGFNTIRNQWQTVLDPDMQMNNTLEIGSAYWIFVREAGSLVPSGFVGGGGGD